MFLGLCYSNLNQSPDEKFQTTCEDLRGFWDMVMLQVNDVDASFSEIDSFRRNGWKVSVVLLMVDVYNDVTSVTDFQANTALLDRNS